MPATDAELAHAFRRGDRSAGDALLVRHDRMIHYVVRRLRTPPGVDRDDLLQAGRMALLTVARKGNHRPEKSAFCWYASIAVRRAAMREIGRQRRRSPAFVADLNRVPDRRAGVDHDFLDPLPANFRPVVQSVLDGGETSRLVRNLGRKRTSIRRVLSLSADLLGIMP